MNFWLRPWIRYEMMCMRSKADASQLNLPPWNQKYKQQNKEDKTNNEAGGNYVHPME